MMSTLIFCLTYAASVMAVAYICRLTKEGYLLRHQFAILCFVATIVTAAYYHKNPALIGAAIGSGFALWMEYVTRTAPELPWHE